MSQEELHQLLHKLKSEVKDLDIKTDDQQELNQLIKGIEDQVNDVELENSHQSLLDNLRIHIERFEVEHPRMTGILNEIMLKLSNIGI